MDINEVFSELEKEICLRIDLIIDLLSQIHEKMYDSNGVILQEVSQSDELDEEHEKIEAAYTAGFNAGINKAIETLKKGAK